MYSCNADLAQVFATPVMVTVAKSIDAPIKLLAPKPTTAGSAAEYAMLGLGDIVIPGLMIALCLRFDLAQYAKRRLAEHAPQTSSSSISAATVKSKGKKWATAMHEVSPRTPFPRPYFWTGIASYLLGLGTTMGVMHTFKAAQPALLYLSPACCESILPLDSGVVVLGEVQGLVTCRYACLACASMWQDARRHGKSADDTQSSARSRSPLSEES